MNDQSTIFSKYLSDQAMISLMADEALIKHMLQFEIALTKAQAKLDIVSQQIADEIETVLNKIKITPADLSEGTLQNGVPVITLLSLVKNNLSVEAKKYVHFGATSQDAMDTVQVLIIRDAVAVIEKKIAALIANLLKLRDENGDAVCMAHTRGQQAVPITFNVKINAWLQPLQRQMQRLAEIKQRLFIVQLGGAAGTLSVYADKGVALVNALAEELQLQSSAQWHTQRDNFCEFTNWLAMLTGILGKMGADILVMAQSEINEVVENTEGGKSSAMPHKNNPVLSEALVALSTLNATLQSQMLQSLVHVNERDATAWILEWNAIPQMLINTGTSLNHAVIISTNIKVNKKNMRHHVDQFLKNKDLK
ncbi:MAG TPA: lyase family protein [Panacibacter sp.]|nr:lyase family protein [Panacibacter sp.]